MKLKYSIIVACLIFSIDSLSEDIEQLSQCGNGKATYYDVTGEGNCGFGDIAKTVDTAAAEELIYDGSRGCGVCYEVMGELGTKIIMIADRCPGCSRVTQTGKIHLDIDERVFPYIDDKNKGVINTSMRMVPCQVTGNVKLIITETNPSYFNAYVKNYKIGVKGLQISTDGGKYKDVKREMWNRFVASSLGDVKSLKVKIISFANEEIICQDVEKIEKGEYDCGKQFSTNYFFDLYSKKLIKENKKSECCKKPSLITDYDKCKVDTGKSNIYNLKKYFLFLLISLLLL
jgi:expansin (peptidoglycan-binding protein)